jgi:hypothetical protein
MSEPQGAIFCNGVSVQPAQNIYRSQAQDEIDRLYTEHYARPDLVHFEDSHPQIITRGSVFTEGALTQAATVELFAPRIRNNRLRLTTISGIGDALWTRGVVRETLKHGIEVYLETGYPWLFWDFEGIPGFHHWDPSLTGYSHRVATYLGMDMTQRGRTVYSAMCERCRVAKGDFKLPIHPDWTAAAKSLIAQISPKKPICVYRPLVHNPGRRSVSSRNPDHSSYSQIFQSFKSHFHTISFAAEGRYDNESIVHADECDSTFHRGEIPLHVVLALFAEAALTYAYPGMGLVAAAAIGAPVIGIFGGYEDSWNYSDSVIYGPSLLIDPIRPCRCMSDAHPCDKTLDIPAAIASSLRFVSELPSV